MIISHKHRFIFIKTKKTAGTSLEIALSQFCGEEDIITPITSDDEEIRKNLGYRGPQNYKLQFLKTFPKYSVKDWGRIVIRRKKAQYFNHIPAQSVKRFLGKDTWDSYYKFCFERNPWDKVMSWYYWEQRNARGLPTGTISEFIASGRAAQVSHSGGINLYTIGKRIAVDRVCKYENMEEELALLCKKLQLPGKLEMPNAKTNYRPKKRSTESEFSIHDINHIGNIFRREIQLFGYKAPSQLSGHTH